MAVVVYTKKKPSVYSPVSRLRARKRFQRRLLIFHRIAPFFLVGFGIFLLANVMIPIFFPDFGAGEDVRVGAIDTDPTILKPVHREQLLPTPKPLPVVVRETLDYTDLSNWFPDHAIPVTESTQEKQYLLSIPKLHIQNAEIAVGGSNLDQHLILYPGTASPGEFGAPVIFGHSVLRQFYNPKETNPRRYISIFSTIMTLKQGDQILIQDGATTYTYRVSHKTEVQPTDRYILEQQQDARQLKLVTCTPEGTTLRRGVVTAILEE